MHAIHYETQVRNNLFISLIEAIISGMVGAIVLASFVWLLAV